MTRQIFKVVIVSIILGLVNANAQQERLQPQSSERSTLTRYEQFLRRTDAIIVTQSHPIGDLPGGGGFKITAKVAWALGETDKVYAMDISGRIVDFDVLRSMQDALDKLMQAINGSFEKLNAASMSYSSPAGLSISYYTYAMDNSPKPKRNLLIVAGSYTLQSHHIEPLVETRNLIAQAREKLISLGAK